MKNILTLRSLKYTTTRKNLEMLEATERFRDMAAVGKLMNALTVAERMLPYQIATFVIDRTLPIKPTILLTGGLLYDAISLANRLTAKYKNAASVYQFHEIVETYTSDEYDPPHILFDPPRILPFQLYLDSGQGKWNVDSLSGHKLLVPEMKIGEQGIPFALALDAEEFERKHKGEVNIDTLESLIDGAVDEFTYAAEEFIFIIAKELGLDHPQQPPAKALKMAA